MVVARTLFQNNVIVTRIFIKSKRHLMMPSVSLNLLREYLSRRSLQQLLEIADRESCYRLVDRRRANKESLGMGGKRNRKDRVWFHPVKLYRQNF